MYSIAGNLREVHERIAASATRSGRDPSGIKLVAVSKGRPLKMIIEAAQAGQSVFGENKAQELRDKLEAIDRELEWHFIGHLQRNKVNMVVGNVAAIHSLDSESLAEAIHRRASFLGVEQDVLIQVNVSGEESKYGVEEDRVGLLIDRVLSLSSLKLRGMMTIAPLLPAEETRPFFKRLREIRDAMSLRYPQEDLATLSMGMTQDFEIAIEEGANLVRIGTAIFSE